MSHTQNNGESTAEPRDIDLLYKSARKIHTIKLFPVELGFWENFILKNPKN